MYLENQTTILGMVVLVLMQELVEWQSGRTIVPYSFSTTVFYYQSYRTFMDKLKQNLFAIIAFFSAIIAGLLFFLRLKSNENDSLKAEKDLSIQREKSKVVDETVKSAQKEIDDLEEQMKEPTKDDDDFWKDYTK